jgi:integrase
MVATLAGIGTEARDSPLVDDPEKRPSYAMLENMRTTIRGPLNWATARGYCKEVRFRSIILPPQVSKERGILSDKEIEKILSLPTQQLWRETTGEMRLRADVKPRPKLKGFKAGEHNPPEKAAIDIRMKAFVLLGPFCGFRRGEERGLRWKSINLEAGEIKVENNFVRYEGDKQPKAGSYGTIPIASELEVVLWELHEYAHALRLDSPDDYILFNPVDPTRPASETALRRGWERIMQSIGISDEERKRRNLCPHGTRHRFATKLIDAGLTPAEAEHMTRHKTLAMLERYSDHISAETMEKARQAVRGRAKEE